MNRARRLRTLLLATALVLLAGCATSHVLTGQPRPPIDPAQVQVYFDPPPGYQEIARLETASGAFAFGEQAKLEGCSATCAPKPRGWAPTAYSSWTPPMATAAAG